MTLGFDVMAERVGSNERDPLYLEPSLLGKLEPTIFEESWSFAATYFRRTPTAHAGPAVCARGCGGVCLYPVLVFGSTGIL
jgi:hypothetical protein